MWGLFLCGEHGYLREHQEWVFIPMLPFVVRPKLQIAVGT